ncbi:MAG: gamma-glutamyl-gamma-aminobutyrate hydrolase family protein [Terriglobia bacterium]
MKIAISVSDEEKTKGEQSPYLRAMVAAGAKPEELCLVTAADSQDFRVEDFDGVLFAGGEDIDPAFYEEKRKYENVRSNRARDEFEFASLDRALQRRVPVFGICRGAQMVNVKFGGTLYQDLKADALLELEVEHRQPDDRAELTHRVTVTDGESRLGKIVQGSLRVNSLHHQGIHRVGHGLKVSAYSEDGLVEAVEGADSVSYLLAVQWHPEELIGHPEQKKLLQDFIAACRAAAQQKRR